MTTPVSFPHIPPADRPITFQESIRWCRRVCRRSNSNFYSSFALLDSRRRQAMIALYAFARITDDLADAPTAAATGHLQLAQWKASLLAELSEVRPASEVVDPSAPGNSLHDYRFLWPALQSCVQQFGIPLPLLLELVDGVISDLTPQIPANWPALDHYCYQVASTVGLACTHIWKRTAEIPEQAVLDCGKAFQLTNILRDVAEDAKRGRIYLPADQLQQYGVSQTAWLDCVASHDTSAGPPRTQRFGSKSHDGQHPGACMPDGDWRALIDATANRAYALFDSGWNTKPFLTNRSQRMFSLIWHTYRDLLHEIVSHKEQLWSTSKIRLSYLHKSKLLFAHAVPRGEPKR